MPLYMLFINIYIIILKCLYFEIDFFSTKVGQMQLKLPTLPAHLVMPIRLVSVCMANFVLCDFQKFLVLISSFAVACCQLMAELSSKKYCN